MRTTSDTYGDHGARPGGWCRRWSAVVALLAATALVLTGCGDGWGEESAAPDGQEGASEGADADSSGAEDDGAPVAHYPLEDSYESTVEGAPPLRIRDDVELVEDDDPSGNSVARFGPSSGLTLDTSDLLASEAYTLAFRFQFDSESTRPGAWLKLVDVKDRGEDTGFYVHEGSFQYYSYGTHAGEAPMGADGYATAVLRRSADGQLSWFVDGTHQADVDDADKGYGVIEDEVLHFFLDDDDTNGLEHSTGRVAWISVYDEALDDATIAAL